VEETLRSNATFYHCNSRASEQGTWAPRLTKSVLPNGSDGMEDHVTEEKPLAYGPESVVTTVSEAVRDSVRAALPFRARPRKDRGGSLGSGLSKG
jgi:hypothetical protein